MTTNPQLVHSLRTELKRIPPDIEIIKQVIAELTDVDSEPSKTKVAVVFATVVSQLASEISKLAKAQDEGKSIKPNKLALILKNNEYLLADFSVIFDENKENPKIHYKGASDTETIYKAYDYLRRELAAFIGYREFDNSTISRAIMQAKNYLEYDKELFDCNTVNALVIEKAYELKQSRANRKNITIPALRNIISSVDLSTQEIESILLGAGWEIVKSGSCATKFFRPKY